MTTEHTHVQPTLRFLTNETTSKIAELRHPNIDEWQARMNAVLIEAGIGRLPSSASHIDSISENGKSLLIDVCFDGERYTYEIPSSIIDAADPLIEAKRYRLQNSLNTAESYLKSTQASLERQQLQRDAAKTRLAEFNEQHPAP